MTPAMDVRIVNAARLTAALAMFAASLPAFGASAGETMRVPICTDGAVRYVVIDLGDGAPTAPEGGHGACHGPCVTARWKAARTNRSAPVGARPGVRISM